MGIHPPPAPCPCVQEPYLTRGAVVRSVADGPVGEECPAGPDQDAPAELGRGAGGAPVRAAADQEQEEAEETALCMGKNIKYKK